MKALIIYDEFASAARANATLQHSTRNLGFSVHWTIMPWPVDLLQFPPTAQEALTEAMDAHLIVFTGCIAQSPPSWLLNWLEQWARHRRIEDAALAVVGLGDAKGLCSAEKPDLSEFAERHDLSVIFHHQGTVEDDSTFPTGSSLYEPKPAHPHSYKRP
jgi:hypothetical protein